MLVLVLSAPYRALTICNSYVTCTSVDEDESLRNEARSRHKGTHNQVNCECASCERVSVCVCGQLCLVYKLRSAANQGSSWYIANISPAVVCVCVVYSL